MWTTILKVVLSFLQGLSAALTLLRENQLREEGKQEAVLEALEEAYEQRGIANEIDAQVALGELTPADVERLRQYQRAEP